MSDLMEAEGNWNDIVRFLRSSEIHNSLTNVVISLHLHRVVGLCNHVPGRLCLNDSHG